MLKLYLSTIFLFISITTSFSYESKAKYAILLDYNNFEILYKTNNIHDITTPSSMTKIMTSYIIFDLLKEGKLELNNKIKVSIKAWRQEGSRTFLEPEKYVSVDNLLKGMLIQSGNDSAVVLAEGACGSIDDFVVQMNKKVKELNLKETNFVNPNGLFHKNHYMSAHDTLLLSYNLIKNHPDYYKQYFALKSFEYNRIKQRNRNTLLMEYEGADGIKTGHTTEGGYSLASSVIRHGQRFIVVVNGLKTENARTEESRKLFDYAFSLYSYIDLYKKNEIVESLNVKHGTETFVNMYTKEDIMYSTKKDKINDLKIELIYKNNLVAPIKKDAVIGYIKIIDGDKIKIFKLYAKNSVERKDLFLFIKKIFKL